MALHLSFPRKSHSLEDLRPLYEVFKRVEPDVFGTWQSIEKDWPEDGERKLVPISIKVRDFLRSRVTSDSESALIAGWADFRRLMWSELRGG
jgi:hypothetical protein